MKASDRVNGHFITPKLASDISGYSIQHIRRLAKQASFESVKVGNNWLIVTESFFEFVKAMSRNPDGRYGPR
jgi:hypothetical protein